MYVIKKAMSNFAENVFRSFKTSNWDMFYNDALWRNRSLVHDEKNKVSYQLVFFAQQLVIDSISITTISYNHCCKNVHLSIKIAR